MKPSKLPGRAGVGLKPQHFTAIVAARQPVGFFEVHAENYMGDGGPLHAQLGRLRQDYALSIHGVGLSIGSMQPLDADHLGRLKRLCDRYEPDSFSEHLAWSSHDGVYLNDLLPLPYNGSTLARVAEHIDLIQTTLSRQILLENPATYLSFAESTIPETVFLAELVQLTGCRLLLDVNNVVVASINQGVSPDTYLKAFPLHCIQEIHIGGHAESVDESGAPLLIDSHGSPVSDPVWRLFEHVIDRVGPVASLVEWDNDVPSWAMLRKEAEAAQKILDRPSKTIAA
ncbi:MNIO family bufferin maturase [Lichenifustis flavocetrariae]|uniref:UPF0276 protein M8523_32235 n=1 Tax=Lichenifustis flavocetrariae TaxID=2949735 RepID=A0AA41Z2L7_9HYPH|nr:DUF692 domain-containing protein [Lichenifustis flavocetrariae]MCW6512579.1 DUF692 domain-containing protein [Lichenifustis flavocetrariae]